MTLSAVFASPAGLPVIHWAGRQFAANAAANAGTMPLVTVTRPEGTTADRPAMTNSTAAPPVVGQLYLDTTLTKFIWWTGAAWIDQTGMPS